ncbi:MAG: hypothetical protein Q8R36_02780 [bacterium]|nr:hypothetical protein [bacterium]
MPELDIFPLIAVTAFTQLFGTFVYMKWAHYIQKFLYEKIFPASLKKYRAEEISDDYLAIVTSVLAIYVVVLLLTFKLYLIFPTSDALFPL